MNFKNYRSVIFKTIPIGTEFIEALSTCNEIVTHIDLMMTQSGKTVNGRRESGKLIFIAPWEPVFIHRDCDLIGYEYLNNQLRAIDREILDYIKAFVQKNSLPPRLGDIRSATKTTSSGACISLGRLVEADKIEFRADNEKGLQIMLIINPPYRLAGLRGKAYYTKLRQILDQDGQRLADEAALIKKTNGKFTPLDIGRLTQKYGLNFKATCEWLEECKVIPTGIYDKLIERVKVRDIYEEMK